jgi:AbrB family looped-hinge helix DNA binding protein
MVREKKVVKISSGNRITIPKSACEKVGLKEGDYAFIDWIVEGNKLVIYLIPAEVKIVPKCLEERDV